ncbi:capsule assembly Wzi family protein [Parapedobacter sp. DT-150]|uniref:capsule assembly Wzi family protein n=1 Tax=Parapedobacter sp. DT-150 TaxID=3396162 RepID=UPI003F1D10AD
MQSYGWFITKSLRLSIFIIVFVTGPFFLKAQVLPVGTQVLEDKYRRDQLLGLVDSTISFTIRPLTASALGRDDVFDPDGVLGKSSIVYTTPDALGYLQILPASLQYRNNSVYPNGWNDGSMIPARGGQTKLSIGILAKYRFLTVQFQPEIVTASNRKYEELAALPGYGWHWYYTFGNRIDMPEYFGKGGYSGAFMGQSSIRVNFDPVSFGISTENLWWGPGIRNSLLMSNTAPGFPHVTINTTRPVATAVGTFEGQFVAGTLKSSGYPPSYTEESKHHELFYVEKPDVNRYFSGLVASYQPRWIKGLSLGWITTMAVNRPDRGNNLRDFLPFLKPTISEVTYLDAGNGTEKTSEDTRIRYSSIFFRWAMPAGKLELYGEYGRSLRPHDGRDRIVQAAHSRGYVLGFRKLLPSNWIQEGDLFQFGAEVTQLSFNSSYFLNDSPSPTWYTHHVVRDGYTHRGQMLGAGIGPGSNIQSAQVSWIRGLKQVGLQFERIAQKDDFFYSIGHINDLRRQWVDLGMQAYADWDFDHLIASLGIQYTHAYNYRFEFDMPPGNTFWEFNPQDKTNMTVQIGVSYRF